MEKQITIDMNHIILFVLLWACFVDTEKRIPISYMCLPIALFLMWLIYNEYTPSILITSDRDKNKKNDNNAEYWQTSQDDNDDNNMLLSHDTKGSKYAGNKNNKNDYIHRHRLINQHREAMTPKLRRRGTQVSYTTHTPDDCDQ